MIAAQDGVVPPYGGYPAYPAEPPLPPTPPASSTTLLVGQGVSMAAVSESITAAAPRQHEGSAPHQQCQSESQHSADPDVAVKLLTRSMLSPALPTDAALTLTQSGGQQPNVGPQSAVNGPPHGLAHGSARPAFSTPLANASNPVGASGAVASASSMPPVMPPAPAARPAAARHGEAVHTTPHTAAPYPTRASAKADERPATYDLLSTQALPMPPMSSASAAAAGAAMVDQEPSAFASPARVGEVVALRQELERKRGELLTRRSENARLEHRLERAEAAAEQSANEATTAAVQAQKVLSAAREELQSVRDDFSKKSEEALALQKEVEHLTQRTSMIPQLRNQIDALKDELAAKSVETETAKGEAAAVEAKGQQDRETAAAGRVLQGRVAALEEMVASRDKQIKSMDIVKAQLDDEIEALKEERNTAEAKLLTVQRSTEESGTTADAEIAALNARTLQAEAQTARTQAQLSSVREELTMTTNRALDAERDMDAARKEAKMAARKERDAQLRVQQLENDLAVARIEVTRAMESAEGAKSHEAETLDRLQRVQADLDDRHAAAAKSEAVSESLQSEVVLLKETNAAHEEVIDDLRKRLVNAEAEARQFEVDAARLDGKYERLLREIDGRAAAATAAKETESRLANSTSQIPVAADGVVAVNQPTASISQTNVSSKELSPTRGQRGQSTDHTAGGEWSHESPVTSPVRSPPGRSPVRSPRMDHVTKPPFRTGVPQTSNAGATTFDHASASLKASLRQKDEELAVLRALLHSRTEDANKRSERRSSRGPGTDISRSSEQFRTYSSPTPRSEPPTPTPRHMTSSRRPELNGASRNDRHRYHNPQAFSSMRMSGSQQDQYGAVAQESVDEDEERYHQLEADVQERDDEVAYLREALRQSDARPSKPSRDQRREGAWDPTTSVQRRGPTRLSQSRSRPLTSPPNQSNPGVVDGPTSPSPYRRGRGLAVGIRPTMTAETPPHSASPPGRPSGRSVGGQVVPAGYMAVLSPARPVAL